jgi:hypothetical protein
LVAPPPLEEWLQGREILTVKQDGSAMFATIQAALDALKPGGVVEVLDKGVYVETLSVAEGAVDCGLVSRVGTVIDVEDYEVANLGSSLFKWKGHSIASGTFRLSGFTVLGEAKEGSVELTWNGAEKSTLDNCCFPTFSRSMAHRNLQIGIHRAAVNSGIVIRDCAFASGCHFGVVGGNRANASGYTIRRCYFDATPSAQSGRNLAVAESQALYADVKECVFLESNNMMLLLGFSSPSGENHLEINGNTFYGANKAISQMEAIRIARAAPRGHVNFLNNVFFANGAGIRFVEVAESEIAHAGTNWNIGLNLYTTTPKALNAYPLIPGDIVVAAPFLSTDRNHRDYLRLNPAVLPKDDNDKPIQFGALPPGPAPPEGDWFTRLQERWKEARADLERMGLAEEEASAGDKEMGRQGATSSPPLPLSPSPPLLPDLTPLDQWLQGREILTVKQDGTAMFTKIQDALDKAKPGQVVKILDRGPYRERLTKDSFSDGGLISESNTIIEPSDYEQGELNGDPLLSAHRFPGSPGLRIAGIDFVFRESVQTRGVHSNSALTVEECRFRFENPPSKGIHAGLDLGATGRGGWEVAAAIRDCEFRGGGLYSYNHKPQPPTQVIVVRRNLFSGDGGRTGNGIAIRSSHKAFVCEQNVFVAAGQNCIVIASRDQPAAGSRVRIANNLFMNARTSVVVAYDRRFEGVTFDRNLIAAVPFHAVDSASQETEPFKDWRVSNNWFVSTEDEWTKGFLAADPSNRTGSLNFLSTDPSHRDYLRLPAASPAAQSDHLGPFPPGPAPPEGDWFTRLQERWK